METVSNLYILKQFNILCVYRFMLDVRDSTINESRFEFTFPLELMN